MLFRSSSHTYYVLQNDSLSLNYAELCFTLSRSKFLKIIITGMADTVLLFLDVVTIHEMQSMSHAVLFQ